MLSAVITAWNEAHNLPRAVKSLKPLADEIIVVDTESTDNTAQVAKKLGCRVYSCPRPGIVEKVRNFSISKAGGDWIILLDADEEIPESLAEFIKHIISDDQADYCRIPRKNIIFGKWITSSHWWPDYVYRLFKKGAVTWQETIHSIPLTEGRGLDFPDEEKMAIVHNNYQNISQYLDRMNRYTDFQALQLRSSNSQFYWSDLISQPFQEFIAQYFSRRGYRDGLHGLALSLLQAFSQLVVYLKLWQMVDFKEARILPADLVRVSRDSRRQCLWWYYQTRSQTASIIPKLWWSLKKHLLL